MCFISLSLYFCCFLLACACMCMCLCLYMCAYVCVCHPEPQLLAHTDSISLICIIAWLINSNTHTYTPRERHWHRLFHLSSLSLFFKYGSFIYIYVCMWNLPIPLSVARCLTHTQTHTQKTTPAAFKPRKFVCVHACVCVYLNSHHLLQLQKHIISHASMHIPTHSQRQLLFGFFLLGPPTFFLFELFFFFACLCVCVFVCEQV